MKSESRQPACPIPRFELCERGLTHIEQTPKNIDFQFIC
jgi:hypothetical protein